MITKMHVENMLQEYMEDTVESYRLIDNSWEDEHRYVAIVKATSGENIVLKCYNNSYTDSSKIAGWARLASVYRRNGIATPQFFCSRNGAYGSVITIDNKQFHYWAEEFMPAKTLDDLEIDLEDLDPEFLHQVGACIGSMHTAAKREGIEYAWGSPYVLLDPDEENYSDALSWYEQLRHSQADVRLVEEIWQIYNHKRKQLEAIFPSLPAGGVQGDFSTNNILVNEEKRFAGIIDYNLAGNDKFVTYMMQEGIFLCFECYREEWLDREKCAYMEQRFKHFYNGYSQQYSLTDVERSAVKMLYNIIRPFRMDKVDTTLRKAEEGLWQEVNERLRWMHYELTRDDILACLES
ncbi:MULTISPECIES: phosphotransferase enzyme family protein [Paenibacillus]|uniref:phosphotransferase enzyme family protein n=1 Tax=Paenibacillus TaxID=44249 RepID=UPI002282BA26|nr:phosphotransferase [Paenibacillus alvei]MCY7482880.1 phosphotransferase [Paenibacillus alvei]